MKLNAILETSLYCDDLDAAEKFYAKVLGLEQISSKKDRHVFFKCGQGMLLIFNPVHTGTVQTSVGGVLIPRHGSTGPGHLAFQVAADEIDEWREHLTTHRVDIEADVTWSSGGRSLYFRDPAGNSIEIATSELWPL
ncbi:MAG: VOC family protein [Candidatus Latescibacterota bacterium]|nr:MAG: VOC family protein [Candidatus Latescibacterota bacterium]